MSNKKLLITCGVLAVVFVVFAALQNQGLLQGRFTSTLSGKVSCTDMPANTIYVSSSSGIMTDGTAEKPYRNLSAVQKRLETDSAVEGVCMAGTLTGTLSLDDALATTLTLKAAATGATLGSASSSTNVLSYSGGNLTSVKVQNITFMDPIRLSDLSTVEFSSNTFSNESGTALSILDTGTLTVEKNKITTGSSVGVSLNTVARATIQNNFIIGQSSTGVSSTDSDVKLYHNSFYNNKYAVYLDGEATVKNNIFYSNAGQYALHFEYVSSTSEPNVIQVKLNSDYNLFYSTDGDLAYIETTEELSSDGSHTGYAGYETYSNLSALQEEGWEEHSTEGNPMFVSASTNDLHISNASPAMNAGNAILSVSTDIDGDRRTTVSRVGEGSSAVDIGADEI